SAAEPLRQALTDENPGVRFESASALWTRGWALAPSRRALFELRDSLGHHAWWRIQVLNCLIIRPDAEIVGLVLAACRDGHDEVRRSAFALLDRIEGGVDDLLREGLRDTVRSIRAIAADEIFRRYGAEGLAWLIRSFQEDPAARFSLLSLIDWRFGEAGRKFLIDVTKSDLDARIRERAERQLSRGRDGSAALADSTSTLHEHPGEEERD
ncbi:MAG TPA: hypothetical protein VHB50_12465, partial [Bryobacteraceae bacterium]|nr:hypothetical protein [Bryobacteraceae bacterium]